MIESGSMNVPMSMSMSIMSTTITKGATSTDVASSTSPRDAPVKARICPNAVEPVRIMNIMTVVPSVDFRDSVTTFHFRPRYSAARTKVPAAPSAADSVGVATPRKIRPMTRKTIAASGNT